MAQITKTVDKTRVNGSDIFIYTINAQFSGLSQPAREGKIVDFFPNKIKFALPPVGGQIQSITTAPVSGGTQVTFHLGSVSSGTSLSFTVACSFGPGRANNDAFANTADLVADGIVVAQATAPTVTLTLIENFTLTKLANPSNIVNGGDELTFVLSLTNNNTPGASVSNVVVTDILPPQLIPVTTFAPIGNDVPSGGFSDPSANGLTGSWSGNTMTFNLPSYSGARYDITFKARVAGAVTPGQTFVNTGQWSVGGISRSNALLTLSVYDPAGATFSLYKAGTRTAVAGAGSPVSYNIDNSNLSGVMMSNYVLEDIIPSQVDITGFRLNAGAPGMVNYSIYIALASDSGTYIPIVQNVPSGPYPYTDLSPFIPTGDRVAKIKLTAQNLLATNSVHTLYISGVTNSTATSGTFINNCTATSGGISKSASWGTNVNGASDLNVSKSFSPTASAYYPLNEFSVAIKGEAPNTITVEPILMDLMPVGLHYLTDSEYFLLIDNRVTGKAFDSRQPNFPLPLPKREVIPNFAGTGNTLLRWSFLGFTLPLGSSIQVVFKAFVGINPPPTFVNQAYEGIKGNNTLFVYNQVNDPLDLDNDGLTTTDRLSNVQLSGVILTTSEFLLSKLVMGQNDLAFTSAGVTVQGGEIDYQLQVTNNQPIELRDIEMVDILPYVGDTGVILTSQPRGSQFNVYATAVVTAQIVNMIGDPVDPNPDIVIEYSTSSDPQRFDQTGNPIGTGSWSSTPPIDTTAIKSVRVTTGPSLTLKPYDRLMVYIKAKAPVGLPLSRYAYNSYAVRANKVVSGGQVEPMLPTEPSKVSVRIVGTQLGAIGSFAWNDLNKNGLYDPNEPGANGVFAELYAQDGTLISSTITADDANGKPGYYLFAGLADGVYQVKFTPPNLFDLTQQQSGLPSGSRPDPITGFTPYITVSNGQQVLDINAGITYLFPPVILASDRCIHVRSAFDPMEGVSATDYQGNDITSLIVITENDVDPTKPGMYSVTYSVTDCNGQTTTKTISVRVCGSSPRQQAITDIFQSVALEQAAFSHILNAEEKKIQKAKDLNLTNIETLKINHSATKMINAITQLEMILLGKTELFDACKCPEDCCDNE